MNDNVRPRLVEPGMKYYINETLKQCHSKENFYNIIFNISFLVVFLLLLREYYFINIRENYSNRKIYKK